MALNAASDGVTCAEEAQENLLLAQLYAKKGHIFCRKLVEIVDEGQKMKTLRQAETCFFQVIKLVQVLQSHSRTGEWDGDDCNEGWYVKFRDDFNTLKHKINELEKEHMTEEQKQAEDLVKE